MTEFAEAGPLELASAAALLMLSTGIVLCFVRLVRGPTLPDRAIALDLIAILLVGILVMHGITDAEPEAVRVATVLALINFLGTIAFAIYIRRKATG